jgi:hypothetical protein
MANLTKLLLEKAQFRVSLSPFMSEQNLTRNVSSEPPQTKVSSADLPSSQSAHPEQAEQVEIDAPESLSAEEQMALYEKALKEDDWGHQPC